MLPHLRCKQSGFTLVEAIVAASLVATALVAIAQLAAVGTRQSAASTRAFAALMTAQGKLEQLVSAVSALGGGEETGEYVLRWTIAPVAAVDPAVLSLQVCAYEPAAVVGRPEACVATLRTVGP